MFCMYLFLGRIHNTHLAGNDFSYHSFRRTHLLRTQSLSTLLFHLQEKHIQILHLHLEQKHCLGHQLSDSKTVHLESYCLPKFHHQNYNYLYLGPHRLNSIHTQDNRSRSLKPFRVQIFSRV